MLLARKSERSSSESQTPEQSEFSGILYDMVPKVIYEDEYFLVLDKPAGWITNSAKTTIGKPVVQDWLAENFQFPINNPNSVVNFQEYRNGIVHRLDKETSGILLVAKTSQAFENLQEQFRKREIKKAYKALVHGLVAEKAGVINAPVGRLPWRRDRFGVLPGGRDAVTRYKSYKSYKDYKGHIYSLVEFYPQTGRTHQIRIHSKHIGHPIVSDDFYAGRKIAREDRAWCPRLFLHASKITFNSPSSSLPVTYNSSLPKDLAQVLERLVIG